MATVPNGI